MGDIVPQRNATRPSPFAPAISAQAQAAGTSPAMEPQGLSAREEATSAPSPIVQDPRSATHLAQCAVAASPAAVFVPESVVSATRPSPFAPFAPAIPAKAQAEGTSPALGPPVPPARGEGTLTPSPIVQVTGTVTHVAQCAVAVSPAEVSALESVAIEFPEEARRHHLGAARILSNCTTQTLLRLSVLCQTEISNRMNGTPQ